MTRPAPWPSPEVEKYLLADLLANKPTARSRFAEAVYEPLVAALAWRHPLAGEDAVTDAAGDALMSFLADPTRYDQARGKLRGYLLMAATGDLLNRRRGDRKHHAGRVPLEAVEDRPAGGKSDAGAPEWGERVAAAVALLSADDRGVLDLMRAGERRTRVFAAALGITGLPAATQAAVVKRIKDRLLKFLQRELRGVR